jgi:hypothetical protein
MPEKRKLVLARHGRSGAIGAADTVISKTSQFASRTRFRIAGPFVDHGTQFVGLLVELPHPLGLFGEIATEFRDLAFDRTGQFDGPAAPGSPPRSAYSPGFRHSILSEAPFLTGRAPVHVRTERHRGR